MLGKTFTFVRRRPFISHFDMTIFKSDKSLMEFIYYNGVSTSFSMKCKMINARDLIFLFFFLPRARDSG